MMFIVLLVMENGEGIKNEGLANGYLYPPLWGKIATIKALECTEL